MNSLNERIRRGITAIARAKAAGKDVSAWEEHLKKLKEEADVGTAVEADLERREMDFVGGAIIALKVSSRLLGADIWLTFRDDFQPGDGLAVFHVSEIPLLKDKSEETLRIIHEARLVFGGGKVVRPEELQ